MVLKTHARRPSVYDTYPCNQATDASEKSAEAVEAVQVALDRRDNGGEAGSLAGR